MQLQAGAICALLGAAVTFSFGLWTDALALLLILMGTDYVTGVIAAIRDGSGLNSNVGFWGLIKKGLVLLILLIAHRLDVVLGADAIMGGAVYFYMSNELLSIIENYGRMGLPLPGRLKRIVKLLRNRK